MKFIIIKPLMKLSYDQFKYFHFTLTTTDHLLELEEFWSKKYTSYQWAPVLLTHKMKLAPATVNLPLNKPVCCICKDKPQKRRRGMPSFINTLVKHKCGETTQTPDLIPGGAMNQTISLALYSEKMRQLSSRKIQYLVFLNNSSLHFTSSKPAVSNLNCNQNFSEKLKYVSAY